MLFGFICVVLPRCWKLLFEFVYPLPLRYDFDLKAMNKCWPDGTAVFVFVL